MKCFTIVLPLFIGNRLFCHKFIIFLWQNICYKGQITSLSLSNFYYFVSVECQMLVVEGIAELVADAASGADSLVNIAMGMAVNPIVDAAGCNIISKFDGEGSIDLTSQKLW